MPWRNRLDDASLDDLMSKFAWRPVRHWTVAVLRRLACHRDDSGELLGAESRRGTDPNRGFCLATARTVGVLSRRRPECPSFSGQSGPRAWGFGSGRRTAPRSAAGRGRMPPRGRLRRMRWRGNVIARRQDAGRARQPGGLWRQEPPSRDRPRGTLELAWQFGRSRRRPPRTLFIGEHTADEFGQIGIARPFSFRCCQSFLGSCPPGPPPAHPLSIDAKLAGLLDVGDPGSRQQHDSASLDQPVRRLRFVADPPR